MNKIKAFFASIFAFLPFAAGGLAPVAWGLIAGGVGIAGFSIYRSVAPVDMASALSFFSSCWSCQLFSDIIYALSDLLPGAYSAIGSVIIPVSIALTAVWFAWRILSGLIGAGKIEDGWSYATALSVHVLKLGFVIALLAAPLPRILTTVVIEPIFSIGFSINRLVTDDGAMSACLLSTAVADPVSLDENAANRGAFSSKLRHNVTCEIAQVHNITGLGATVGWTLLNMAFNDEYMHKLIWDIPIFPNVPIFFIGLFVLSLFIYALLPVPLYFLQIFIKLGMDLIMLPFMLLSWVFDGWKILPFKSDQIQDVINRVVQNTLGIAMIGLFLSFAIIFLDTVFGQWSGGNLLATALQANDSTVLMEGVMMNNDSLVVIILFGLFLAMFMTMIPVLISRLFSNAKVSNEMYDSTKKTLGTIRDGAKKWYESFKKQ